MWCRNGTSTRTPLRKSESGNRHYNRYPKTSTRNSAINSKEDKDQTTLQKNLFNNTYLNLKQFTKRLSNSTTTRKRKIK